MKTSTAGTQHAPIIHTGKSFLIPKGLMYQPRAAGLDTSTPFGTSSFYKRRVPIQQQQQQQRDSSWVIDVRTYSELFQLVGRYYFHVKTLHPFACLKGNTNHHSLKQYTKVCSLLYSEQITTFLLSVSTQVHDHDNSLLISSDF